MTGLHIAPDLDLPIEAVTETFAILAKRGKGKTNTAVVMVEEMVAAGMPVVVIDPVGVWWGVRSSADGTSDGLPVVIFGGDHADVPLEETAGELIADVVVDRRMSAVIDLSSFSKAGQRRFMAPFIERLYHRNREALHVVVDEADAFAPQRTAAEGARLLGAMEDLVRRGRARGIGVTLITQRPAVIHKDVLTQAEVLIALGMTGPRDIAAIDEWIKLHADEAQARDLKRSLPSLPVGTAWVWSPGWLDILQRVDIRARWTFDSSATPKPGERRATPQRLAPIDLEQLGQQISDTVERKKAEDPNALRRRVTDLERQLTAEKAKPAAVAEPEVVEVQVLDADLLEQWRSQAKVLLDIVDIVDRRLAGFTTPDTRAQAPRTGAGVAPGAVVPRAEGAANAAPAPPTLAGGQHLKAGARRMVQSLGRMAPLRLTKSQWGTVAHLKTSGGTWSTYLGEIRRAGLVDETAAGYTLTDAGFDYLGGRPDPMTPGELQDHYRAVLKSGAAKMFDALLEAHPAGLTRDQLGAAADIAVTGGTFSTYLGSLTRNGLAERRDGLIFATDLVVVHGASS